MDGLDRKICSLKFDENKVESAMIVELDKVSGYQDKIVESIVFLEGSLAEGSIGSAKSSSFASNPQFETTYSTFTEIWWIQY